MENSYNVSLRTIVFRVFLVAVYICFGAGVFYVLERDQGLAWGRLDKDYNNTMKKILIRCSTNESELGEIMKEIHNAFLQRDYPVAWGFISGISLAVQVITTIGYGDTVPKSAAGRAFLIGYAVIGIPLTAMMLTTIGEKTKHFIKSCIVSIETNVFKKQQPRNINGKSVLAILVVTVMLHLVMASISTMTDGWSFSLSIYVWFVTLTTIGFGDYVPQGSGDPSLLPIRIVYAFVSSFLGLALIASILHIVSDWINSRKAPSLKESIGHLTSVTRLSTHKGKADITKPEEKMIACSAHIMAKPLEGDL